MAYDLLEQERQDIRGLPQHERRARLEALLHGTGFKVSPIERHASWLDFATQRQRSRELGVEGFMLKRLDAAYGTGRTKAEGLWWKWKIDPMTIDCVLIYAQAGHGRRASVYTDYTFAVWNRQPQGKEEADAVLEAMSAARPRQTRRSRASLQLVAFAKAYSGLTDEEFRQVDAIIRKTTLEKFGPVRSVKPSLVFELGFEGINRSPRHKSGIAVQVPPHAAHPPRQAAARGQHPAGPGSAIEVIAATTSPARPNLKNLAQPGESGQCYHLACS